MTRQFARILMAGCAVLAAHVAAAVPVDYCAADGTARQTNATVVTASAGVSPQWGLMEHP